jgi:hypothetical protein
MKKPLPKMKRNHDGLIVTVLGMRRSTTNRYLGKVDRLIKGKMVLRFQTDYNRRTSELRKMVAECDWLIVLGKGFERLIGVARQHEIKVSILKLPKHPKWIRRRHVEITG